MPNRIVREGINSSPKINALSMGAELFYRRLMLVADDFGRFHGSIVTLRGACWPTNPEKVTERELSRWMNELLRGDDPLVKAYSVRGAAYIEIQNFHQQTRAKSRFPDPPWWNSADILPADCNQTDSNLISDCEQNVIPRRRRSAKAKAIFEGDVRVSSPAPEEQSLPSANAEQEPAAIEPHRVRPQDASDSRPDFHLRYEELYSRHPLPGYKPEGQYRYLELISTSVHPEKVADAIDRTHAVWVDFWQAHPTEYVPGIGKWFEDGYYLRPPKAREPTKRAASLADRTLALVQKRIESGEQPL